jgi:hypothetical protein
LCVIVEFVPRPDVEERLGVAFGHLRVVAEETGLFLSSESLLAQVVPTGVVASAILRDVLRFGLERTVHCVVRHVAEEGLVRVARA